MVTAVSTYAILIESNPVETMSGETTRANFRNVTAQKLSNLMLPEGGELPGWSTEDLAAMLRHQLQASLESDLVRTNTISPQDYAAIVSEAAQSPRTFGELFSHPTPPLNLLKLVKDFAKLCRTDPDHPLPTEITMVLYHISVLLAQVRCATRISSLSNHKLRQGCEWVTAQAWVDPSLRRLVHKTIRNIT